IDLQLESGEFFLKPSEKAARRFAQKKEAQAAKSEEKRKEREKAFEKPLEAIPDPAADVTPSAATGPTLEDLKRKFTERGKKDKRKQGKESGI
ncbi:hypothetical protein HDU93_009012, partial [Gonapodya sp. JEL0774]